MQTSFGASSPYTVGVEEEFQLTDPRTRELTPAIERLLAAGAGDLPEGTLASELSASCLEVRTPVYASVPELARALPGLRARVRRLAEESGARLVSAGAHPFSPAAEQPITGKPRYRKVDEEMGWPARMQAIYGLHVHVAVPDGERAVRAVAALARHVPLFIALAANSPFWEGRDTRLASVRAKVFGLIPRSGLPPRFGSWEEFEAHVERLVRAGSIRDYTFCWWDVRPHPKLGTVELRAPDAQTDPGRTVALAALAQCLAAAAEEFEPEDPLLTEENKWRATRYGLEAELYDFRGERTVPARRAAEELVAAMRPVAGELGCEAELEGVLEISRSGTGAERQRAFLEREGSLKSVVDYLAEKTAPTL
ncbi:Putative glutamate--cysteine ligase 2 [Rubrobacter xylanophilus DSM 9941]|uniref:glutamate--cysteine ligase n=1 Tax=Rubrobacter xylanophilus TaxID=49319 RepID=UPI001C641C03|nr:glutamate--cysteine ligase [Rubrobacter xylanophilus]QYJ14585.1 Putative glutamate--cysteine ligase 2 [Rubrobacter xylanophilus DSM 9941]